MDKLNFTAKKTGDTLEASEWNSVVTKVDELVEANNGNSGSGSGTPAAIDTNGLISVNNKGNVTIGSNNIKNINLEPGYPYSLDNTKFGDIALKPGDDILFASHHREPKKRDKIVIKNIDGSDNPVKLQTVAGEIELAVGTSKNPKTATKKKDKTTGADTEEAMFKVDDAKTLDIKILTGSVLDEGTNSERDERGYLKVRAQAIDLRCEKHGGIALLPKGYDNNGNMNKIKFEHGGGDGLEFGTFNTDKTSLYTNEYRFKKDGIWKMATRETVPNSKTVYDDNTPLGKTSTAALKYIKLADDFYDIVDSSDYTATTKDIIKTAATFNGAKGIESHITNKGNLEIETECLYTWPTTTYPQLSDPNEMIYSLSPGFSSSGTSYPNIWILGEGSGKLTPKEIAEGFSRGDSIDTFKSFLESVPVGGHISITSSEANGDVVMYFQKVAAPNINIESALNIKLEALGKLELKGILDFGDTFNFGETEDGIQAQYKLTKNNTPKDCGKLQIVAVNNHASNNLTIAKSIYDNVTDPLNPTLDTADATIEPGTSAVVASCPLIDVIRLVNYMKYNQQGPWNTSAQS